MGRPETELGADELKEEMVTTLGRGRLALPLGLTALTLVSAPSSAGASSWERPAFKGRVAAAALEGVVSKKRVRDVVRTGPLGRKSSSSPARVERYVDARGYSFRIGTSVPGADLQGIAGVLAGTVHRDELSALTVRVVRLSEAPGECRGPRGVVACYVALDPDRRPDGLMVVAYDDPDLTHTVLHEYGHHMDNQLLNLAHLGGCDYDTDGSRRWFFARDADDRITESSDCDPLTPYALLLGELYAEDYAALNGIRDWQLTEFPPPSSRVLSSLRADISDPLEPRMQRARGRLRRRGASRTHLFTLSAPTFFSAHLGGPRGRTADFDLYLYRRGARRPIGRSRRRGSREALDRVLPGGEYELRVHASRGSGGYRLGVDLE